MATVKKSQGFTLIEVLIASAVSLISLGVICTAYYVGMETFRFNQKRMEAINTLCLSTDRIKKEIREGEKFISSDNPGFHDFITSLPDPDNSLIFASSDITAIAFYFEKDSNGQFHLYKKTSGSESKVIISFENCPLSFRFSFVLLLGVASRGKGNSVIGGDNSNFKFSHSCYISC